MARSRPILEDWTGERLSSLTTMDPKTWVQAVLATWDPKWVKRAVLGETESLRMFRPWTYGDIREAVFREIARRNRDPTARRYANPEKTADAITWRGLGTLQEEGGVEKKGNEYRLTAVWDLGALMRSVIDGFVANSKKGRTEVVIEEVSTPKGRPILNRWYKAILRTSMRPRRFPDYAISYQFPIGFRVLKKESGIFVELAPPAQLYP